jgi:flavin-dependent dehydrogenase
VLDFEVLIVGCGPAGATAALNLAPIRRTAVIDSRAKPAVRIGESLPAAARRLFIAMGIFESFLREGHAPCHGNRSVWGNPMVRDTNSLRDLDGPGWHLDREAYETWLRRIAMERGAHLVAPARLVSVAFEDKRWTVTLSQGSKVRADFLIDASGRSANLARRLGARIRLEDRLVCRWTIGESKPTAGLTLVEAVEEGWWYTAPVPGGRRVLAFYSDADLMTSMKGSFIECASKTPELSDTLRAAQFVPLGREAVTAAHTAVLIPCAGPRWLAAGDAALSFDPLSSQGLLNTLFTGLAAGESADRDLAGDNSAIADYVTTTNAIHSAYRKQLDSSYQSEMRWPHSTFWRRRQSGTVKSLSRAHLHGALEL